MSPTPLAPAAATERIASLDILRGVALFGILVMNIQAFAMIAPAYTNPVVTGPLEGTDFAVWLLAELFFNNKFITLFTLLFGAGIVLMDGRAAAGGADGLALHRRRMLGLGVIGLAHAYLIWFGDILFVYALCGLLAVHARNWPVPRLLKVALVLYAVPMLTGTLIALAMQLLPPAELEALRTDVWAPDAAAIAAEIEAYRGGWLAQMSARIPEAFGLHAFVLPTETFWSTMALMLAGMAAFRSGLLTGQWTDAAYGRLALAGAAIGLALTGLGVWFNLSAGWRMESSLYFGRMFNHWGAPAMAMGWLALVMLSARRWPGVLSGIFAPVGRMALSNYLLQSVICTFVFYGHGLGLFEMLSRSAQLGVVALIWLGMPLWSRAWLSAFRYGPAEWLWRSVSYGRRQPLRRRGGGGQTPKGA